MKKKKTRAELLKGSETLKDRLKRELKDPSFAKAYKKHLIEVEVAEKLYALREKKGLTQLQLAEKVGMRQSNLARIERGGTNLTLKTIQLLAGAMGCRVELELRPARA